MTTETVQERITPQWLLARGWYITEAAKAIGRDPSHVRRVLIGEPDAGLRASVEAAAQDSGYGVITKRMNLARIAAKNAGVPVTWDYYLGAIKKLQDMEDGNMPDDV